MVAPPWRTAHWKPLAITDAMTTAASPLNDSLIGSSRALASRVQVVGEAAQQVRGFGARHQAAVEGALLAQPGAAAQAGTAVAAAARALEDDPVAFADAVRARRIGPDGGGAARGSRDRGSPAAAARCARGSTSRPSHRPRPARWRAARRRGRRRDRVVADLELAGCHERGGPTRCLLAFTPRRAPPPFDEFSPAVGYCIPLASTGEPRR